MQENGTVSQPGRSLALVVGAGASQEVNLPTGNELKRSIAEALNFRLDLGGFEIEGGDQCIAGALRQLAWDTNESKGGVPDYLSAARLIRDAMPQTPSIDNFIESHRTNIRIAQCGKLAIASCILKAERKSLLHKINFSKVENTWFNRLFRLISENCESTELQNGLSFLGLDSTY